MTRGGLIVHGVDDRRTFVGCPLSQNTQDRITGIAGECGVDVQLLALSVGELELTICAVPEVRGRIVTTPDGRLLRRVGGDSQPLRRDSMARFVREREHRAGEDEPLAVVDLSAFDLDAVNQALAADGRPAVARGQRRTGVDRSRRRRRGRAAAGIACVASRAGALRVGTAGVRAGRRRSARASRRRRGPGPSSAREECAGPLADTVDCCLRFVAAHTRRFEIVAGSRREALPEYPEPVLREAIVNALAHRDYGLAGATVDITVWDDRIEVRSPGPLPGHITLENMRAEHYSRNPRIMRVMKIMGLVEEYGEGIDRMYREMEARLMEPPVFEVTASSVRVILRNRMLVDVEDQRWLNQLDRDDVTADERRTVVAARRAGAVAPRDLRAMLPDADVDALLSRMVAKGLLSRVGRRGGTRYVLSDALVRRAGNPGMAAHNRRRQALLDEIRRRGSLSTNEAATLLDAAPAVARGLLNELVRAGLARAAGRTRARRYHLR